MNPDFKAEISQILEEKGSSKSKVIPILQAIQSKYNYLPEEMLREVCERTEITPELITGIATFYSQFRLQLAGKHTIKVCVGTACHVKGSGLVHDAFRRELKLTEGEDTDTEKKYTIEKVSCLGCCTLAPVVQIDNVTYGHVSTDQTAGIIKDFEKHGASSKKKLFRTGEGKEIEGEIRIGLGSCCVASGSDEIRKVVEEAVDKDHLQVKLKHVGCVGMCHQVPLMEIVKTGSESQLYAKVTPDDAREIVEKHFKPKGFIPKLTRRISKIAENILDDRNWDGIERYSLDVRETPVSAFLDKQVPVATEHRGVINPVDIEEYMQRGGFTGLKKALLHMKPEEVINIVRDSEMRGRGGAGFPTATKWELVAKQDGKPKYLICNGDEGDPGAFMDRMILESYPYRVIEGILIAAYAIGADKGYLYLRAEYPLAVTRISQALVACRAKGYLGDNILGSGFSIDLELYQGAGAFVCGEETALIASIEGNRGFPRIRPPFPAEEGLWGAPTLVNNTETYSQIPFILKNGSEKFNAIGTESSRGTKVFALAGKVARGGLIEVPMGITIREIVEEIGGGVADGHTFKAVQIGGPSGGCIPASLADTRVDFESLGDVGAMMGSGGLVVLDERDCMVDIARYFLSFTQNESCGKCTFCRVGTRRMLDILNRLCEGTAKKDDLDELERLSEWVKKGSLCGLGKTAPNPVITTLKYFREEYEAHLNGVCPTGKCSALITYSIDDKCIGCTLCAQKCPVDAIAFTPHEQHKIDTDICIKCDSCRQACPVDAIRVE